MNKVLKWIVIGLGIALVMLLIFMVAIRGFALKPSVMIGGRQPGFHLLSGGMMLGVGLFLMLRILFGIAVLGLAVFGLIALFKNQHNVPANTVHSGDSKGIDTATAEEPKRTCVKCSQLLQIGWKNCPYCGKRQ